MHFSLKVSDREPRSLSGATGVLRRYRLNYCCSGDVTLAHAAAHHGIEPGAIAGELETLDPSATTDRRQDTDGLIDHIVDRYHTSYRRDLPELIRLALKVEAVHKGHPAVPEGLSNILEGIRSRLDAHMQKEEQELFPGMRNAGAGLDTLSTTELQYEHDALGMYLHRIESLTDGFRPPEGACRTWQALYTGTARFVEEATEHVHLENNVLFPRFE